MTNLIDNPDYTQGFYTPFVDEQGKIRGNMRVPIAHEFTFREGAVTDLENKELNDPSANPETKWLAPEMVFRSDNVGLYPFTELLPPHEWAQFLAPDAPIVYHIFHSYGKQWWKFGPQPLPLPAGRYRYAIEVWPDVYTMKDGQRVWDTNPLSYEARIRANNVVLDWFYPTKGQWGALRYTFEHPGGACLISLEVRQRYGVLVGGTFLRRESLERVDATPEPVPTPKTPIEFMLADFEEVAAKWRRKIGVQG